MTTIKLKEDNILRVEIHDSEDKPTGEYLTFDIEDIELPLRFQQMVEEDKKNNSWLRNQLLIINKKQDIKGKKLFSKNEEDKVKLIQEFFQKEMKTIDLFLGDNGCNKLLNGRKPYLEMFNDIVEMLEPIIDELDLSVKNIETKIKNKYKEASIDDNILK